jgi:hypothetical protein
MMPCRRRQRRIVSENREAKFQVPTTPISAHLEITRSEFRMVAGESILVVDAIHIAVCGVRLRTNEPRPRQPAGVIDFVIRITAR